jgi:predicted F0F1-ATPase subunit
MTDYNETVEQKIKKKLARKTEEMKMRYQRRRTAGFGMIASLGGVIITPILLGIFGGGYLDEVYPQSFSWRLNLLFLGLVWGLVNAYFWLKIENEKMAEADRRIAEKIKRMGL